MLGEKPKAASWQKQHFSKVFIFALDIDVDYEFYIFICFKIKMF